jgi:hypothetical protein
MSMAFQGRFLDTFWPCAHTQEDIATNPEDLLKHVYIYIYDKTAEAGSLDYTMLPFPQLLPILGLVKTGYFAPLQLQRGYTASK